MKVEDLQKSTSNARAKLGHDALSTISFRFTGRQRMTRLAPKQLKHDKFRSARVGRVRRAGFPVRLTDEVTPGHCTVFLPQQPTNDDIERLVAVFGKPITRKRERR